MKLRPICIQRWAKSSGDIALAPHIEDIEAYATQWKAWYMSALPKCRVGQKGWPPLKKGPTDPLEWKNLTKGSKKGLVLLLVSLSWWETQATMKKHKLMASAALKDVLFVVRQLAAHVPDDTSSSHKRTRGPENSRLSPTKRCEFLSPVSLSLPTSSRKRIEC